MKIERKNSLELIRELLEDGIYVFNSEKLKKKYGWKTITTYQKLKVLMEKKLVERLWRGFYMINPKLITNVPKAIIIDAYLKSDYYMGLYTALTYWKLTDTPHYTFQVITRKRALSGKIIEKKGINAIFIYLKEKYFFGFKKYPYQGALINISDMEKTIIDSTYYLGKHVLLDDIIKALQLAKKRLKIKKLISYLEKIASPTVNQRLGFLLEKMNYERGDEVREKLRILNRYIPLDPAKPLGNAKKNEKWRVIVNTKIKQF